MPDRLRRPASLPGAPKPKAPPRADAVIYLDWDEVHRRTTLSRSTVWRLERLGHFPAHVHLSPGRVAWREADIVAWMAKREQTPSAAYVASAETASQ